MVSVSQSSPQEFTVDSADIIRLILGYLTQQGLHQSADILRQESGIGFPGGGMSISPTLPEQIRRGEWGTVLRAVQLCQNPQPFLTNVHEQVLLELAESDDTLPMAYNLLALSREELDQQLEDNRPSNSEEQELPKISKARSLEQRLAAISAQSKKYATDTGERLDILYGSARNKQSRRDHLVQQLMETEGTPIPFNRLPTLIQQACKWQAFTGQLPWIKEAVTGEDHPKKSRRRKRRKHLDLVRGVAAGDVHKIVGSTEDKDEEDGDVSVPLDIRGKVKFGKSAVCEAAHFIQSGLITASSDGLIEVWDERSQYKELNTTDFPYQASDAVMGHDEGVAILCLTVSNDQTLLVSGDSTGKVKVWKLSSGQCLRQYQAHDGTSRSVTCVALSRDASRLLTGSSNGTCREFGLVSQHVLQEYTGHSSYIQSCEYVLKWSQDGDNRSNAATTQVVVTSSADGTVRMWQQGQCHRVLQPQPNVESMVVDSSVGNLLLPDSPAIASLQVVTGRDSPPQLLVVPRSSTAYLVNWNGTVVHRFQAESSSHVFCAGTLSHCHTWVYLCTTSSTAPSGTDPPAKQPTMGATGGDCLVFRLRTGKLQHTIRDFNADSTSKRPTSTGGTNEVAEVTQLLSHPAKPTLAAFSNDKTQKKGVLTLWG